jgi:predicted ATPase
MPLKIKPYLQQITIQRNPDQPVDSYPFSIPAIRGLKTLKFSPDVTFFVGENGSGKSTVLEAIAIAMGFNAEGGTKNLKFRTAETISDLHLSLKLKKGFKSPKDGYFLRAESFYNVATEVDKLGYLVGYGNRSLHERSHGEAFMTLLTTKLKGNGFYLLDEPEAALSPSRQLAALCAINRLVDKESQFIIATHSPILLAYPSATIVNFDGEGLAEIAYENTEHFGITRDFLNHYQRRLEHLLSEE